MLTVVWKYTADWYEVLKFQLHVTSRHLLNDIYGYYILFYVDSFLLSAFWYIFVEMVIKFCVSKFRLQQFDTCIIQGAYCLTCFSSCLVL